MVAVHDRRLFVASGKAEMPGVVDIMSCMSSFWRLDDGTSVDAWQGT